MTQSTDRRSPPRRLHTLRSWAVPVASLGVSIAACGVQEHPHEIQAETGIAGVIFRPPPADAGGTGGTPGLPTSGGPSATSGAPNATSGGPNATSGAPNATGGAPNGTSGAPNATSGAPNATGGAIGSGGGAPAAAGSPGAGSGNMAGRSGITVDINGTMLPKEDVIAFIHVGHSNMLGYGTSPTASRAYHFTDMNLRAWAFKNNTWSPALERTAGSGNRQAGPGTALVKQAVDLAPTRYFVSLGYGAGSAYCSQFLKGGLYYDQYMAMPMALKGKVTFGAIVIMLGITERHGTDQDISNFPNCINSMVTAIRTDLGEPELPVLLCDYEMGSTGAELSPTGAFGQKMIPRIREVPMVVSKSAIVPTEDLGMQDDHHFNLDGQKEWARRVLVTMKDKGWFPW